MIDITATCPDCHAKLSRIDAFEFATDIRTRTCKRCRAQWQLKITPKRTPIKGLHIHEIELLKLN